MKIGIPERRFREGKITTLAAITTREKFFKTSGGLSIS
jgi:hypothetical protein